MAAAMDDGKVAVWVANNIINDRHNNQQTMRVNNYEKLVFDGSGGQGQQWWRWCLIAAEMDNNEAVARQQRQRGGCNYQMKMTLEGGGGRRHSMAATKENSEVAEHSTAAAMDNGKATVQQDLEAATEQ
jgi:hypothetical protein